MENLNSRSAVPIYSNWESLIGSGIVGGHLVSLVEMGKLVADIILSPHTAKPVVSVVPMRNVYDGRGRGIPRLRLCMVLNRRQ